MIRCHPERWKNVADRQPRTNASHRAAVSESLRDSRLVCAGSSADGSAQSISPPARALDYDVIDAPPPKIREEPLETALGSIQIDIVAKPRLQIDAAHSRLSCIDFPRMEVENCGLLIAL